VSRPFEVARLDELGAYPVGSEGLQWRPVRRRLDVEAFGVNAYTVAEAGQEVVEHHDEVPQGGGAAGHEELYVVLRGRATFTLDGEEVDAPAGTLVFVRDPAVRRGAVAREPETAVLAVGGAPGEPYRVSPWEYAFEAFGYRRTGEYERGLEHLRAGLDRYPESWALSSTSRVTRASWAVATTPSSTCDAPSSSARGRSSSRRPTRTSTRSGTTRASPSLRGRRTRRASAGAPAGRSEDA
jgi:quercetin dioxygenase-like cupin family protein